MTLSEETDTENILSFSYRAVTMERIIFFVSFCVAVEHDIGIHLLIQKNANWFEAQAYCQKHHIDVSFFYSQSEMDKLPKLAGGDDYGWIDIHRDPNNKTAWMWSVGGHVTFQNWYPGQPDNYWGNQNNVVIDQNGKWYDVSSSEYYYFYCFDVVVVVEEKMSWEDALNHCREKHTDLISLLSETDRLLDHNEIKKKDIGDRVWMGLRFLGDRWMWVNGDPLEYEAWSQEGGQDHQCPVRKRCGALTKEGLWENWDCQDKLNFICV